MNFSGQQNFRYQDLRTTQKKTVTWWPNMVVPCQSFFPAILHHEDEEGRAKPRSAQQACCHGAPCGGHSSSACSWFRPEMEAEGGCAATEHKQVWATRPTGAKSAWARGSASVTVSGAHARTAGARGSASIARTRTGKRLPDPGLQRMPRLQCVRRTRQPRHRVNPAGIPPSALHLTVRIRQSSARLRVFFGS